MTRYATGCKLGRGSYADVFLSADDSMIAIKVFRNRKLFAHSNGSVSVHAVHTIVAQQRVPPHPNVTPLLGYVFERDYHAISMPCAPYGSLQRMIRKWKETDTPVSNNTADAIARNLLSGIAWMHEHGVSHGDINPQNILVFGRGMVKLADFDLAQPMGTVLPADITTPAYEAPDVSISSFIEGAARGTGAQQDLWSAGCSLAEVCLRSDSVFPFAHRPETPSEFRHVAAHYLHEGHQGGVPDDHPLIDNLRKVAGPTYRVATVPARDNAVFGEMSPWFATTVFQRLLVIPPEQRVLDIAGEKRSQDGEREKTNEKEEEEEEDDVDEECARVPDHMLSMCEDEPAVATYALGVVRRARRGQGQVSRDRSIDEMFGAAILIADKIFVTPTRPRRVALARAACAAQCSIMEMIACERELLRFAV